MGIESSCDETGVALFDSEKGLLANSIYSQTKTHEPFGGIVPELASRDHIAVLLPMIKRTLSSNDISLGDLSAIAYTAGPGLIGSLMVGGTVAHALSFGSNIPVIPVHHMEAHLLSPMLEKNAPEFPFLALLVSGGHTLMVEVSGLGKYKILGSSLDDAAGEAFDKVARLLLLPQPGGPSIQKIALNGDAKKYNFPRPLKNKGYNFSFSGLKTAVRLMIQKELENKNDQGIEAIRSDIAASFEEAVVDTLVSKCLYALKERDCSRVIIAGGVGANKKLRLKLKLACQDIDKKVFYPRFDFCTDNGAMVAYVGYCRYAQRKKASGPILIRPRWKIDELEKNFKEINDG